MTGGEPLWPLGFLMPERYRLKFDMLETALVTVNQTELSNEKVYKIVHQSIR
jgi:hypothetical protein